MCSQAGRYDNPIPTWFLAPIDCFKIPAQVRERDPLATLGVALDKQLDETEFENDHSGIAVLMLWRYWNCTAILYYSRHF